MVKNKFAVMTLTSLALTLNAGVVRAEDDAMFSMDDGFSADSIFDVDAEQNAQQSNNAGAEVAKDASVASDKAAENVGFAQDTQEDPFAAMSASLEGSADAKEKEKEPAANANTENATGAAEVSTIDNLDDMDAFSKMQNSKNATEGSSVADRILGSADNSVFKEMAAIERETALLELKAKREKLLSEIENSKANLRRNQLEELERREQITRNRINWEVEQEQSAKRSALELEQVKREMERQERIEREERAAAEARKAAEAEAAKRQQETAGSDAVSVSSSSSNVASASEDEDISTVYTIEEVRGVGGELYATLLSDNGTINVREGYPLKGGYKVSKITTSFVEVKKGDKVELLRFATKGAISN